MSNEPMSSNLSHPIRALVIGINDYPYLKGNDRLHFNLKQLKSPVPSARAFADWLEKNYFKKHFPNGKYPEKHLQVLLSGGSNPPTADAIMKALELWRDACAADPESVAVLYCVGHGFEMGSLEPWLLAEDYGVQSSHPFQKAINLSSVVTAMETIPGKAFCYLFDCCRTTEHKDEILTEMYRDRSAKPQYLTAPEGFGPLYKQTPKTTMWAVPSGQKASAPIPETSSTNGLSFFMEAILGAFRGKAGDQQSGHWVVHTDSLRSGIPAMFECARRRDKRDLPPPVHAPNEFNLEPGIIHSFEELPVIPLEVFCEPLTATKLAAISALHRQRNVLFQRSPGETVWHFEGPVGQYTFDVTFSGGEYEPPEKQMQSFHPRDRGIFHIEVTKR